MTMLHLPYVYEGDVSYLAVTITQSPKVCKRKAKFVCKKKYAEFGIKMPDVIFEKVWKCRYVTKAMTPDKIDNLINDMARRSYEEAKEESDTDSKGEVAKEATE